MKINLWKLLLAALIASTALVACKDERNNFMVDDTVSFLAVDNQLVNVALYNEECDLTIIKSGKGQSGATVRLAVSDAALSEYNAAHGTDYKALPANYVTLPSAIKFSEKDIRKMVKVSWDDENINSLGEGNYAVAIELSVDNNALEIPEERRVMIVSMGWSHLSMGAEVAPLFSPAASRKAAVYEGPVTIDNPIAVMDITVNYEIDNSLIAAYNEANGTNYQAISADACSLVSPSSVLAAGEASTAFSLQLLSEQLFNGNELKAVDDTQYLVPVRITSLSNEAIAVTTAVTYVPISFNRQVCGPWTILEGENNCYGKDPNAPTWALGYTANKLFDGILVAGGEWISSWDNGPISFPMTFVVDMGETHVFTKFLISDYTTHQGNYREYEIYIADVYNGGGNTQWTLVADGKRDYKGWTGKVETYDYPVKKMIAGRYLKFMIMKPENPQTGDYLNGRGKLADVQGMGF